MYILYGILFFAYLFVIIFLLKSKKKNNEIERQYGAIQKNLIIVKEQEKRLQELRKEEERLKSEYANLIIQKDELDTAIASTTRSLEKLVEEGKAVAQKRVREEVESFSKKLHEEALIQHEQVLQGLLREKIDLNKMIDPLREELEEYKRKQSALQEAMKREMALEQQKDFYRIQLDDQAIADIQILKEILGKLNIKTAVAEVIYKVYIESPLKDLLNRVVGLEQVSGVYKITNIRTKQCYIGQGVNVRTRLTQHVRGSLGIQSIARQRVHEEMAKEGLENWTFELLEKCEKQLLNEREKYYIHFFGSAESGYNRTKGVG